MITNTLQQTDTDETREARLQRLAGEIATLETRIAALQGRLAAILARTAVQS